MTLDEIVKDVRNELNEPTGSGIFTDYEIAAWANRAQELLVSKIQEADQNFFEQSDQSIAFVAQQEEYTLPAQIWNRKITRVTRTDTAVPKPLSPIRFQEKEQYHSQSVFIAGSQTDADVYYIRGQALGLKPTPQFSYTPVGGLGNILVYYLNLPHDLHFSDAGSPTSTTLVVPTATIGNPRMRAGRVKTIPNYYVGARLRFITPGLRSYCSETVVTAYNANTRVMTFSPAVDFSDLACVVTYVQYVVLTPIPDEYHEIIMQETMRRAAKKKGDLARVSECKELLRDLWNNLTNTIEPRHFDENAHVRPPIDQNLD